MPYKYRAIEHSPHSRSAGILQGTVDWASPSPAVRTTHPACVCVNALGQINQIHHLHIYYFLNPIFICVPTVRAT